eukprot:Gregarina_sp_Poly_1__3394@NODE_1983_length_2938_cov_45_218042_g1277_i0_p3_GENE_NODE_1983_length_2938_cov_45_218042_g1277_i0NODE_1983_length_2938_cov_45_218042_g1277_i0_p3_ORF_typecomplete_len130_score17_22Auts2/PF15336_6/1_1PepSY_TM_like_2/PF16357_5/1_2DUF3915/PF13054_6/3_3e03DUF3915/PF13054_6/0_17_NODE_1983_length_2938_cov_45_218042_g1277_i020412430
MCDSSISEQVILCRQLTSRANIIHRAKASGVSHIELRESKKVEEVSCEKTWRRRSLEDQSETIPIPSTKWQQKEVDEISRKWERESEKERERAKAKAKESEEKRLSVWVKTGINCGFERKDANSEKGGL